VRELTHKITRISPAFYVVNYISALEQLNVSFYKRQHPYVHSFNSHIHRDYLFRQYVPIAVEFLLCIGKTFCMWKFVYRRKHRII